MFLNLLVLILSCFSFSMEAGDMHASSEKQSIERKKVVPFLQIKISLPWDGHFSAESFRSPSEKLKLKRVKKTLEKTIMALPNGHVERLKSLEVRNKRHISRGMANSKKMILHTGTIENQKELAAVFIHEMGHIVDFGYFRGKSSSGRSLFKDGKRFIFNDDLSLEFYQISWSSTQRLKRTVANHDFVSGYAKSDCFEDFAESYLFYRVHGEKFRALMKNSEKLQQKYAFMKEIVFDGKEFQKEKEVEELSQNLVWDATLLTYEKEDLFSF